MAENSESSNVISRRKYVGSLVAGTAALAGCSGGSSEEQDASADSETETDGEQSTAAVGASGERVPQLTITYWADNGAATSQAESYLPVIRENWKEIGVEVELVPKGLSSAIGEIINDERTTHFNQWTATMTPERLDPDPQTWRWHAGWAGANGRGNAVNYASCEYTEYAFEQRRALTEDERRTAVESAHQTWAEDVGYIPMYPDPAFGAYWEDSLDAGGVGDAGVLYINPNFLVKSKSTKSNNTIVANTTPNLVETTTFPTSPSTSTLAIWNNTVFSPLLSYNEDQELQNTLAKDYTVEDEATTFTFELRDGTFHNGDPITAEDVKWSYGYFNEYADFFPKASKAPYESIEVVDEKTVRFNTTESFRPLLGRTLPRWGVLPKEPMQEAGIEDNPSNWNLSSDQIVGSGPFQVSSFSQGESIQLAPHDGHPLFSAESNVLLLPFDSAQASFRAFENQEINVLFDAAPSVVGQIESLESQGANLVDTAGLMEAGLAPQMSYGPTMFREFRMAVSQAIDRELAVESAVDGRSTPNVKATIWSENHPWQNVEDLPPIADSTSANPEAAKDVLTENGWSFDDEGRLRYPEDVDLTPMWPKGSEPAEHPDDFPCVEELDIEPAE